MSAKLGRSPTSLERTRKTLSLRLDEDLWENLNARADAAGISVTKLINDFLRERLTGKTT